MLRALLSIIFACLGPAAHAAMTASPERAQIITDLQNIKRDNTRRLEELEVRIRKSLENRLAPNLTVTIDEREIENLNTQRQERLLEQDFLDRLIFQVDTKYAGGDLRNFLSVRLSDMARADLLSRDSQQTLWKLMTYLSQALRDMSERDSNVIGFIEGYLKASSFLKPIRAEDYLKSRQYTNGRESVAVSTTTLEQAGEQVEKRLPQQEPHAPATNSEKSDKL